MLKIEKYNNKKTNKYSIKKWKWKQSNGNLLLIPIKKNYYKEINTIHNYGITTKY